MASLGAHAIVEPHDALGAAATVLVVEDDASIRRMLEVALKSFGFQAFVAARGQDAIDLCEREPIDFVLLDVQMPGLDGPNTLLALRRHDPQLNCCFMTGNRGPYTTEMLQALGPVAILDKPFQLENLRQLILNTVRDHR